MNWQGRTTQVDQTLALGAAVGRLAQAGDLIALVGELGAGKTQFVRGLARGLDSPADAVTSPTFVMVQEYEGGQGRPPLVHIDAYRLHSLHDLESIGWEVTGDRLGGELRASAVVAVEWADRVAELLGEDALRVTLTHEGDDQRGLTVEAVGSAWRNRWPQLEPTLTEALGGPIANPSAAPLKCPTCRKPVREGSAAFPFCSERCRMVDLGKWIQGDYVISRPIEQADLDEE